MALLGYCLGIAALFLFTRLLKIRYRRHLRPIPGPFIASCSNLWKIAAIYRKDMPGWNVKVHEKYGPVVRIGPNHVSFANPKAFHLIYNSTNSFPKSDFYEVGAPIYHGEPLENLFSLRDVSRHSNLRRNIGSLYTKESVKDFESRVDDCVSTFLAQIAARMVDGRRELDLSQWLHFFAFDCLSEINISKRLGFMEAGRDVDDLIKTSDKIFELVGLLTQAPILHRLLNYMRSSVPAEEAEPILKRTHEEVNSRCHSQLRSSDMAGKLLTVADDRPDRFSPRDVTAAVFINLTAGHDVLAVTLRAVWYYLSCNPRVRIKLRHDISEMQRRRSSSSERASFSEISKIPYLNAVILESLRIHPVTGTIIERQVPKPGVVIDGHYMPGGTTVGVNAWVLHRDEKIFGDQVDQFYPERWLESSPEQQLEMNRCLFTFGAGRHTCIGRNIAQMMMSKLVFEFYQHYDTTLPTSSQNGSGWDVHGTWVTKQTGMKIAIST